MTALQTKLQAAGLKFQVKGPMALGIFATKDDRTHAFSIHLPGEDWGGVHEHDVIFKLGKCEDNRMLKLLCSVTNEFKRGGIVVSDGAAFLKVELPTDLPGDVWMAQLEECAQVADLLEQVLDPENDRH